MLSASTDPTTAADHKPTTWNVRLRCCRHGWTLAYVVNVDACHPDRRRVLAIEKARSCAAQDYGRAPHFYSLIGSERMA